MQGVQLLCSDFDLTRLSDGCEEAIVNSSKRFCRGHSARLPTGCARADQTNGCSDCAAQSQWLSLGRDGRDRWKHAHGLFEISIRSFGLRGDIHSSMLDDSLSGRSNLPLSADT